MFLEQFECMSYKVSGDYTITTEIRNGKIFVHRAIHPADHPFKIYQWPELDLLTCDDLMPSLCRLHYTSIKAE